jgi:hypothetical protein
MLVLVTKEFLDSQSFQRKEFYPDMFNIELFSLLLHPLFQPTTKGNGRAMPGV